jgi:pimeloyl-ACP methyl ester carboxylesterase
MAIAKLKDIQIYYEIIGEGYPVVLIQGMSWGLEYWMNLGTKLAEENKVIMYDNRGSGRSDKPRGKYSIRMMADDLNMLLEELDIPEANIMGISMGGLIAQEFTLNYTQKVNKLIIGCSWCGKRKLELDRGEASIENLDSDNTRNAILNSIKRYASDHLFSNKEVIDNLIAIEMRTPQPLYAKIRQSQAFFEYCSADRLDRIDKPTLVLVGDSDTNIPSIHSKDIYSLIPNVQLHIIESANHLFWLDNPEETYRLVRYFLAL